MTELTAVAVPAGAGCGEIDAKFGLVVPGGMDLLSNLNFAVGKGTLDKPILTVSPNGQLPNEVQ